MKFFKTVLSVMTGLLMGSCSGSGSQSESLHSGDTLTERAELLTLIDCGDYVAAIINDPWQEGKVLASYALVQHGADRSKIPVSFTVVEVPLRRSLVDSSTNTAAIIELGALDAIAAVADGNYYPPSDTIARRIADGRIADIGSSMSPKVETLIDVSPDAILASPYKNAGHGVLSTLRVPVIECADYMETTPLARAEWLLLLGELYDKRNAARRTYDKVLADYDSLRSLIPPDARRPKVLTELLTSGVWYVPGGKSYMSRLLSDAGAEYPWSDDDSTGSLQLDIAAVLDKASDADVWIMRTPADPTLGDIDRMSGLYSGIKAFNNGRIYNCNTTEGKIFNDIAFHPEQVLADFIIMFHPDLMPGHETRYYKKVETE